MSTNVTATARHEIGTIRAAKAPIRVLVAGDANLDIVLQGDVVPRFGQAEQLLSSADVVLGSSAGICASGIAKLGIEVSVCGRVGDDLFGNEVVRLLEERGVGTSLIERSTQSTGITVVLSGGDDRAILTHLGAMAEIQGDSVIRALDESEATHLHVAAFYLLPALAASFPEVLREARRRGVTTSLDTNWDPVQDWSGLEPCLPLLDVLLPNAAEALALARRCGSVASTPLEAARSLALAGPTVVVKDGAAGAFAVSPDGRVLRAPSLPVDAVDTTGAGDSFDAGFLAAWCAGASLNDSLRCGVIAGSLSTRAAGGTKAQATAAEISMELGSSVR